MGGISDDQVEWAVVNRLKAMLDDPPKTKFNVTQSFAIFSSILLWTKQRAWVGGNAAARPAWFTDADHAAQDARDSMRATTIFDPPWSLSKERPEFRSRRDCRPLNAARVPINLDFEGMTAEQFIKWLRDALAHGDGRTIRPLQKPTQRGDDTLLAGFQIACPAERGSARILALSLYHSDMKRIGAALADAFCTALSGGNQYFEQDAATRTIEQAA
jgi:hypothetical protein